MRNNNQTGLENPKPQQWVSGTFCLFRQDFVFWTQQPKIIIKSRQSQNFKFSVMHMLIACLLANIASVMSYMHSLVFPKLSRVILFSVHYPNDFETW